MKEMLGGMDNVAGQKFKLCCCWHGEGNAGRYGRNARVVVRLVEVCEPRLSMDVLNKFV